MKSITWLEYSPLYSIESLVDVVVMTKEREPKNEDNLKPTIPSFTLHSL